MTLQTALGYVPSNPNLIINGGFTVNQRVYTTGTALAAGVFAHDRWKAGAAGGAYSFTQLDSPTTITITAGTFIQVVETKNVQGGSYVLSWTGTATGRYGLNSATPSGSYVASPILIAGQTAGTAISVEFGTGTLTNVKLEMGTVATPFVAKPYAEELINCMRYYQKSWDYGTAIGTATVAGILELSLLAGASTIGDYTVVSVKLPVTMRTTPTIVSYDSLGASGKCSLIKSDTSMDTGITATGNSSVNSSSVISIFTASTATNQRGIAFHYTTSAEL